MDNKQFGLKHKLHSRECDGDGGGDGAGDGVGGDDGGDGDGGQLCAGTGPGDEGHPTYVLLGESCLTTYLHTYLLHKYRVWVWPPRTHTQL